MPTLRVAIFAALLAHTLFPANLAVSTYLKDGFTPSVMASDAQGNVFLAGRAVIDPVSGQMATLVAKLDPKVSGYLYLTYLDSAASDSIGAMTADAAGNVYLAGTTYNPNFPAIGGGQLGGAPMGGSRSFITKLDPHGAVVFSVLIGGVTSSTAQGVMVTEAGQILVSGIANASGFPTTTGAYTVPDSNGRWFLMELDSTASKMIFSATGIGGSSMVVDGSGNIYMAGSSSGIDYPTTPGAYQTTFAPGYYCYGLCQIGFPGGLQHVTKVDGAATKLLYSTGLNDPNGASGNTVNAGLAVDSAGNAYVTGTVFAGNYPLTVAGPTNFRGYLGYLSKLDGSGSKLLFSIPAGGAGVQVDPTGAVYVGGFVNSNDGSIVLSTKPLAPPSALSWVPQVCWPDNIRSNGGAYVVKVDAATGGALDSQWLGGSGTTATSIAMAGGRVWITGTALTNDIPFSPGVFTPDKIQPGFLSGGYVAAVDFSGGENAAPAIACVLDSGNLEHVGPVAPYQLISIFGQNLGPAAGVAAPTGGLITLGGVSITFDGIPAQLLYVSSSQINVVVPWEAKSPASMVMTLAVEETTVSRQFPVVQVNPNLFADLSTTQTCAGIGTAAFQPLALNADGSTNSCTNRAAYGSTFSLFVHGSGLTYSGGISSTTAVGFAANVGSCPAVVNGGSLIDGYVYKVDVSVPFASSPCSQNFATGAFLISLTYNGAAIGPRAVPQGPVSTYTPGVPLPMVVWVK